MLFNNGAITRGNGFDENNMKHLRQKDFFPQVLSGDPYPIKGFLKFTGNPVHNCPNRGRWLETFNAVVGVDDADIGDMVNNYGASYAGGWDTIWDCACNVRKLEEKKGA